MFARLLKTSFPGSSVGDLEVAAAADLAPTLHLNFKDHFLDQNISPSWRQADLEETMAEKTGLSRPWTPMWGKLLACRFCILLACSPNRVNARPQTKSSILFSLNLSSLSHLLGSSS